jgi:hypothetical protein
MSGPVKPTVVLISLSINTFTVSSHHNWHCHVNSIKLFGICQETYTKSIAR